MKLTEKQLKQIEATRPKKYSSEEKFLELLELADLSLSEYADECCILRRNARRKFIEKKKLGGNVFLQDLELILHLFQRIRNNNKKIKLNDVINKLV